MKPSYVLGFVIVTLSTSVWAADPTGNFNVLGMGTKSCGDVVSDHQRNDWGKLTNSIWVGGFLTAINAEVHQGFDVAQGTNPAARDLWIFNYCSKNPLDSLYRATAALVVELEARKR